MIHVEDRAAHCRVAREIRIIEVHSSFFSEAPHLRSSTPHPKTDFSKNQTGIPINSPMAQVCDYVNLSQEDWHSDGFGLRIPDIQKILWRKCATHIVERALNRSEIMEQKSSSQCDEPSLVPDISTCVLCRATRHFCP